MAAGYSKRSLIDKLGIEEGFTMHIFGAPKGYARTLGKLPGNIIATDVLKAEADFIQFFTKSKEELEREFPRLKKALNTRGMLWICWPKALRQGFGGELSRTAQGKAQIKTDLNENIIREIGLANGMVDVKVIAVDETWSGLKFVFRLKDRK